MKKNILLAAIFALISTQSFAENNSEGFFLKSFATIEYSAPTIGGGGANDHFKTNVFEKQIKNFENIAIGAHFRVHKFLGFNVNWAQSELSNTSLQNISLSQKAHFNVDNYNVSALFFTPKVENKLEFFAELGVSDMRSKLNYTDSAGNLFRGKSHTTALIYGGGIQLTPFEKSKDAFRISFQKYSPQSSLLHANYMTVRIGYLKAF